VRARVLLPGLLPALALALGGAAATGEIDVGYSRQTAYRVADPDVEGLQTFFRPALEKNRKELTGTTGVVKGFGAGDLYPQIWLRDSATLIPLSRYLYPREYLASWVEEHFAHQSQDGALFDWIAAGPPAHFAPWAPSARLVSPRGSPPLSADKNTIEADQEASAVLALCQVFSITGDRDWLLKAVGGRPLLEGAHQALRFLLTRRFDPRLGLVTSGFSADWGDVSPAHADQQAIYLDARTPQVAGLYTNALFHGAATRLADVYASVGNKERAAYWRSRAEGVKARLNERLWQESRGFYRLHLPAGRVPPPAFDDSDTFAMGGNALAILTGVADERKTRRILKVAEKRRKAAAVSTIAGALLPPYPRGLFQHPAMREEYAYQNGGQWDWFAGRLLSAAFDRGQARWAYPHLVDVAKKAVACGGLYEWHTREGRGKGSSSYAGSAGALAGAVFEGLFGVSLTAERLALTVRLGERPGRIHLYQPATDTYVAYDYRPTGSVLTLRYRSNHPRPGKVSVLIPAGRRVERARLDGKNAALESFTTGDDAYATLPTDWGAHRLDLHLSAPPTPSPGPSPGGRSGP